MSNINEGIKKANNHQIKMIHTLKNLLMMSEKAYRTTLWRWGVTTSKDLLENVADQLIQKMTSKAIEIGVWKEQNKNPNSNCVKRANRASPGQINKIIEMWYYYSDAPTQKDKLSALNSFINKKWKIARIEWIPPEVAGKVICAIRKMLQHKSLHTNKALAS